MDMLGATIWRATVDSKSFWGTSITDLMQAFAAIVALAISVWSVRLSLAENRNRDRIEIGVLTEIMDQACRNFAITIKGKQKLLQKLDTLPTDLSLQKIATNPIPWLLDRHSIRLFILGDMAGRLSSQLLQHVLNYNSAVGDFSATQSMSAFDWQKIRAHLCERLTSLTNEVDHCQNIIVPLRNAYRSQASAMEAGKPVATIR